MISGFSAVAEAWVTPELGRNISEILPHSTPFLNGQSELLDIPSAMDRGKGIQMKCLCFVIFKYWDTWFKLVMIEHVQACLFFDLDLGRSLVCCPSLSHLVLSE